MNKGRCLELMLRTSDSHEQIQLREHIRTEADYYRLIILACLSNPFFQLLDEEIEHFSTELHPPALRGLVLARDAARRSTSPKFAVFCMPKSGSSFVSSALQEALQLPATSLTSFGAPAVSSYFGMNSREQELDGGAILISILSRHDGFVAQAHTRYSRYLALQVKLFQIQPIVTVRNILDCMVSFDEMVRDWRRRTSDRAAWVHDPPFALPIDYPQLPEEQRYELLGRSYGIWLINFYLSWKRCQDQAIISPLWIRYEDDVLNPSRFVERISSAFNLAEESRVRLAEYARAPEPTRSRFNIGKAGRGRDKVPERVQASLVGYASAFQRELSEEDIAYLIG